MRRDKGFSIRLSSEEKVYMEQVAQAAGLPLAQLIRSLFRNPDVFCHVLKEAVSKVSQQTDKK